jgi:transposase
MRRDRRIANVALARKLAVSLFWMWRKQQNGQQEEKVSSHAG